MKKMLILMMLAYASLTYSQKRIENVSVKVEGKKVTIETLNDQTVSYSVHNVNKPNQIHSETTFTNIKGTSIGYYPSGNYIIKVTKNGRTLTARFTVK